MVEKRIDSEDGQAYTYEDMCAYYKGQYKRNAMDAYWETCKVLKAKKGKGKGAEPKAKAKAKAKVKAKAKAQSAKPKAKFKVVVCGGAGGIGQPLSMLLAMNPAVGELCVQDLTMAMVPPAGVAADLGHLERPCKVTGYAITTDQPAVDQLEECLSGAHLVMIPAGVPRKPGMTRDDLFKINAGIAKGLVEACAKHCPDAILGIIVNPVNSVVPAMAELYEKKGLDPMKVIGVTTLDCVRANKFVAGETGKPPSAIRIPVVGGHAGATILPLFSQDRIGKTLSEDQIKALDARTQDGGTEVVEAKAGKGSATLSMAYSGARFGNAVLAGLGGKKTIECAYVRQKVDDLPYFSSKITFGKNGVEKVHPVGTMSEYETTRYTAVCSQLKDEIAKGLEFAKEQ
jgi:malate dehydrogenase